MAVFATMSMVVLLGYQLYEVARDDYGMSVAEASFQLGLLGLAQFIPLFVLTPIAGLAELDGTTLRLRGEILRPDGSESLTDDQSAPIEDGAELGRAMAAKLLAQAGEGFFDWRS